MPTAGSDVDIVLQTSGSTTITGLMLARDADGAALEYAARRLPTPPSAPLTYTQNSWHLGFGDFLARRSDPHRYAFSDGVDARYSNSLQLVPNITERDYIIRNPGGERGDATQWSAGGSTTLDATGQVKYGSYGLRMATSGSVGAGSRMSQELANPSIFRSVEITVGCWLRVHSGTGSAIKLRVHDTDGSNTTGTDSSTTTSGTYTWVEATHTVQNDASTVTVDIQSVSTASGLVYDMDGMIIKFTHGDNKPRFMQEYGGAIYLLCGSTISTWSTSKSVFELVKVAGADRNFTNAAVHGGFIYVSVGADDLYYHSNDVSGARTLWTEDALEGRFLQAGLKHNGNRALYGVDNALNHVRVDKQDFGTAITASGHWEGFLPVGEKDKTITNIFWALDSLLVGKEEGLFYFYAPDGTFRAVTDQFRLISDPENFDIGMEYTDGWFYTTTARHGLVRLRFSGGDAVLQPVGPRHQSPIQYGQFGMTSGVDVESLPPGPGMAEEYINAQYDDFGGRIRALTHDGMWLYGVHDRPIADTVVTKTVILMAAKPDAEGFPMWHTLRHIDLGVIGGLFVEANDLYIFGTRNNTDLGTDAQVPYIFAMALPTKHQNMMKDATVNVESTGTKTFVTPIIDFADEGFQHDDKAWLKVELTIENINSDRTVTVETQIGAAIADSGGWTSVGSAITSTTANEATVAFTANSTSVGKRCRLRFTLATNVTTLGPVIREYRVFAVPAPEQYYAWDMTCHVGTGQQLLSGQRDSLTTAEIISNVETLGNESYPIKFNDIDGTQYNVNIDTWEKITLPQDMQSVGAGAASEHLEQAIRLRLREIKTS